MQIGSFAHDLLSNGAIVTDIDAHSVNLSLLEGYSIRHIETWHRGTTTPASSGTPRKSPQPTSPTNGERDQFVKQLVAFP